MKKKKKLSPEERTLLARQKKHKKEIRSAFDNAGFKRIADLEERDIVFEGTKCDMDDVYISGNLIVVNEYTVKDSGISDHLKKKLYLYKKIIDNTSSFVSYLFSISPNIKNTLSIYPLKKIILKFVYSTDILISSDLKDEIKEVYFFDAPILRYFYNLSKCIKHSALHEYLDYLEVDWNNYGEKAISPSAKMSYIDAFLLPNEHSNFGIGFSVVSFYISAAAILDRSYVFRRDSWRTGDWVYQRLIKDNKISSIRDHILSTNRVFANNIIVSLPDNSRFFNPTSGNTVDAKDITSPEVVKLDIPERFNVVGIIDGQHRVFAYHKGGRNDEKIEPLRNRLSLLVTGIKFPYGLNEIDKRKFEAELFLEINARQTGAPPDVKQAIEAMAKPFSAIAIARGVIRKLNKNGVLRDIFSLDYKDPSRLKTASIVSFALNGLVAPGGSGSLSRIWEGNAAELEAKKDYGSLNEFEKFCAKYLNIVFGGIKTKIGNVRWSTDTKINGAFLNVTNFNGIIRMLRAMIENDKYLDAEEVVSKLEDISSFKFSDYKSSQYTNQGIDLYQKYLSEK